MELYQLRATSIFQENKKYLKKPVDKIFPISLVFAQIYGKVCSGVLEGGNFGQLEHL
jgi:hypothetical protein